MKTVIEVSHLSKRFGIGKRENYYALRDTLTDVLKNPLSLTKPRAKSEAFWALKDISFTVNEGEILGLIGSNGAGKSTLLKILSRITPPTEGEVRLRGRVGSLLEVGTGFHPELTGRENIFMNGAVLGMSRLEVSQAFDEIVEFAEVAQFLDTPMKHYSSGMYTRLAFSVAAHLSASILLVDEVLAVGDVEFQKKCLGKMDSIAKSGRTIIFVSHNIGSLQQLCTSGVVLEQGKVQYKGPIDKAITSYLQTVEKTNKIPLSKRRRRPGLTQTSLLTHVEILNAQKKPITVINAQDSIIFRVEVKTTANTHTGISLTLRDENQRPVVLLSSGHLQNKLYHFKNGISTYECHVPSLQIASGRYSLECSLVAPNREVVDFVPEALYFTVEPFDPYEKGFDLSQRYAAYHVPHQWKAS